MTAAPARRSIETVSKPSGKINAIVRSDYYDGRRFIKAMLRGLTELPASASDFDLDIKAATLAGFHGEALRDAELKLVTQDGQLLEFALAAKLANGKELKGYISAKPSGQRVINLEAGDAGAFLRFMGVYRYMRSGADF